MEHTSVCLPLSLYNFAVQMNKNIFLKKVSLLDFAVLSVTYKLIVYISIEGKLK